MGVSARTVHRWDSEPSPSGDSPTAAEWLKIRCPSGSRGSSGRDLPENRPDQLTLGKKGHAHEPPQEGQTKHLPNVGLQPIEASDPSALVVFANRLRGDVLMRYAHLGLVPARRKRDDNPRFIT